MINLRSSQKEILDYQKGKMGISAVPGSGKTFTLSLLAFQIIKNNVLTEDQEVLIVTLVNSAVENFSQRVGGFLKEAGLLPNIGYRVRTLHGLAHDIIKERPDLAGISDQFSIIDEREADQILADSVNSWLKGREDFIDLWLNPDLDSTKRDYIKRDEVPIMLQSIAKSFIRLAKDQQITPTEVRTLIEAKKGEFPLLKFGCDIYFSYQRALNYRSAVDFDDLIRLALQALTSDPEYLAKLQKRWPYILEDEAQDSSRLQEEILRLLCGNEGNWVRVGDPNQAIYETFTTASPAFLRNFLNEQGVQKRELPTSGRSTQSIIDLANELIRWTNEDHPIEALRGSLTPPKIKSTDPSDAQPNPPDQPEKIFLSAKKYSPEEEIKVAVSSIKKWLSENPEKTAAILVPRNERGAKLVEALQSQEVPYIELLRANQVTRHAAKLLSSVINYLAAPDDRGKLAHLYQTLRNFENEDSDDEIKNRIKTGENLIKDLRNIEDFIWPITHSDLKDIFNPKKISSWLEQDMFQFRDQVQNWLNASSLPVDQLILTISQDIFSEPADLAIAHKLAILMERTSKIHPDWDLSQYYSELKNISENRRKFSGFSEEDTGFDPNKHLGMVTVATIHKAKGLEWNRVHLLSVSNYDFPSAMDSDHYIPEKYYLRNQLNLEAEVLSQLDALIGNDLPKLYREEGEATLEVRLDYSAERLRLLFVGITRAKNELILTWNSGRRKREENFNQPALPFIALHGYWENTHANS